MAVTIDDVEALIAAMLHKAGITQLPPFVPTLCQQALDVAVEDIRSVLGQQGFVPADIARWTGLDARTKMQAASNYLSLGLALDTPMNARIIQKVIDSLDQKKWLAENPTLFDINGDWIVSSLPIIGFGPVKVLDGEPFRDSNRPAPAVAGNQNQWRDI